MDDNTDHNTDPHDFIDTEQLISNWIQDNGDVFYNVSKRNKRPRENTTIGKPSLWESNWGILILDPRTKNLLSYQGKRFKRRFRVPFPIFTNLLVPMCKSVNLFDDHYLGYIPIEFKILIALRILARGNCADDIAELSNVGESTINSIFKKFVTNFVKHFLTNWVSFPEGERLQAVMKAYDRLGMTGAFASMDCTHLWWNKCPESMTSDFTNGKYGGHTTTVFQAMVGPNKEVFSCSNAYPGSYNDKMVSQIDPDIRRILQYGAYKDVEYLLFDKDGIPRKTKGAYLIVDGGYQKVAGLQDPTKTASSTNEIRFAEWMESVRKDVECLFGILKARF